MKNEYGIIGVLVCIIIIILLIFTVGGMYYYYNYLKKEDNSQFENLEKKLTETIKNESDKVIESVDKIKIENGFKALDNNQSTSSNDFTLIYNALLNNFANDENNNIKSIINNINILSNDLESNIPDRFKNENMIYRKM